MLNHWIKSSQATGAHFNVRKCKSVTSGQVILAEQHGSEIVQQNFNCMPLPICMCVRVSVGVVVVCEGCGILSFLFSSWPRTLPGGTSSPNVHTILAPFPYALAPFTAAFFHQMILFGMLELHSLACPTGGSTLFTNDLHWRCWLSTVIFKQQPAAFFTNDIIGDDDKAFSWLSTRWQNFTTISYYWGCRQCILISVHSKAAWSHKWFIADAGNASPQMSLRWQHFPQVFIGILGDAFSQLSTRGHHDLPSDFTGTVGKAFSH